MAAFFPVGFDLETSVHRSSSSSDSRGCTPLRRWPTATGCPVEEREWGRSVPTGACARDDWGIGPCDACAFPNRRNGFSPKRSQPPPRWWAFLGWTSVKQPRVLRRREQSPRSTSFVFWQCPGTQHGQLPRTVVYPSGLGEDRPLPSSCSEPPITTKEKGKLASGLKRNTEKCLPSLVFVRAPKTKTHA